MHAQVLGMRHHKDPYGKSTRQFLPREGHPSAASQIERLLGMHHGWLCSLTTKKRKVQTFSYGPNKADQKGFKFSRWQRKVGLAAMWQPRAGAQRAQWAAIISAAVEASS